MGDVIDIRSKAGARGYREQKQGREQLLVCPPETRHYPERRQRSLETILYAVEGRDVFGARREVTAAEFKDGLSSLQEAFHAAGYGELLINNGHFSFVKNITIQDIFSFSMKDELEHPFHTVSSSSTMATFLASFDKNRREKHARYLHPQSGTVAQTEDNSVMVTYALRPYKDIYHINPVSSTEDHKDMQHLEIKKSVSLTVLNIAALGYFLSSSYFNLASGEGISSYPLGIFLCSSVLLATHTINRVVKHRKSKEHEYYGIEVEIKQNPFVEIDDDNKKFYNLRGSLDLRTCFKKLCDLYNGEQIFQKNR